MSIECYLLYLLFKDLFKLKPISKLWLILSYLGLVFIAALSIKFFNGIYLYFVLFLLHSLILQIFFEDKFTKKIVVAITTIVIVCCLDIISGIISAVIQLYIYALSGKELSPISFSYLYYITFLVNIYIYTKIFLVFSTSVHNKRYISHVCLPLISLITIGVISVDSKDYSSYITIILIILLSNILYFINQKQMVKLSNEKAEYDLAAQQANHYLKSYEILQQDHKDIITLKHNFKYDLISIQTAIKENNLEKALEIINTKLDVTQQPTRFICNIPIINALINYKIFELDCYYKIFNDKIILDIQVIIDTIPQVDNGHLSNILGNLIDNAITACKKDNSAHEKTIWISICQYQNNLNITVRNKTQEQPSFNHGLPLSSKRVAQHGIGLTTIRSIVKKYNGSLNVSMENGEFVVSIVLFNCCNIPEI